MYGDRTKSHNTEAFLLVAPLTRCAAIYKEKGERNRGGDRWRQYRRELEGWLRTGQVGKKCDGLEVWWFLGLSVAFRFWVKVWVEAGMGTIWKKLLCVMKKSIPIGKDDARLAVIPGQENRFNALLAGIVLCPMPRTI